MNDFTKEELEHLYDGLWNLMKLGWIKTNLQINKKIQTMIENYCEHDGYAKCRFCGNDFRGLNE